MTCAKCFSHIESKARTELPCQAKPCPWNYSELALPDTGAWLELYQVVKSETLARCGLSAAILQQADAIDGDTAHFILAMDSALEEAKTEERRAKTNARNY